MTTGGALLYAIDAGGTTTSLVSFDDARWTEASINPSAAGEALAARRLARLLGAIVEHAARSGSDRSPRVWLASASIGPGSPGRELERILGVAQKTGFSGEIIVSNDAAPLALGLPTGGGCVVAVCGTGSCFVGNDGRNAPIRVGGCEYLASDEGSAFDLGMRGLRAAVRGRDGRGRPTALTNLFERRAGTSLSELGRTLALNPFPKTAVAELAPIVVEAWLDGDAVAGELIDALLDEQILGIQAAHDLAGIDGGWSLRVTGGLMTGWRALYDALAARAVLSLRAESVALVSDPATAVLVALRALSSDTETRVPPAWLEQEIWRLPLGESAGRPKDAHLV